MGLLQTIFFEPIYNLYLLSFYIFSDVGLAVIFTVLVFKIAVLPLTISNVKTQRKIKEIKPEIEEIKRVNKGNKEGESRAMLALYRDKKLNLFTPILSLFVQIPFIIYMFIVFVRTPFDELIVENIYSFIQPIAQTANDITILFISDNTVLLIILSVLAGVSQFISTRITLNNAQNKDEEQGHFQKMLTTQIRYVLPIVVVVISITLSSVFAIYIIAISAIQAIQEAFIIKKLRSSTAL